MNSVQTLQKIFCKKWLSWTISWTKSYHVNKIMTNKAFLKEILLLYWCLSSCSVTIKMFQQKCWNSTIITIWSNEHKYKNLKGNHHMMIWWEESNKKSMQNWAKISNHMTSSKKLNPSFKREKNVSNNWMETTENQLLTEWMNVKDGEDTENSIH